MLVELAKKLPTVETPKRYIPFKKRVIYTGIVLLLYLTMGFIPLYGVAKAGYERFRYMQLILASEMGTLITLGIGPIVTGSIILQLLVGAKVIELDLTKDEDRRKYEAYQKVASFAFCFFEAFVFVSSGAIPVSRPELSLVVALQLAASGVIIILLDELVGKYGIGSGISLFIAAGVCKDMFIRAFNPISVEGLPAGLLPRFFHYLSVGEISKALTAIAPIISTLLILLIVVYINEVKVEVPLTHAMFPSFGRRWPLRFLYTSNIPVILTATLLANLQVLGSIAARAGITTLASYDEAGNLVGGLLYYISAPRNALLQLIQGSFTFDLLLRMLGHIAFMVSFSILFSVLWVETSGMGALDVARQLKSIGLGIPGFRRHEKAIASHLQRYIMPLAVMGGAFVGFLAALANFLGALGTGTGILLTAMILTNFYETISYRYLEEMHPMVRKFFE